MDNTNDIYYNFVFDNGIENIVLYVKKETTVKELIETYLKKKEKSNLLINNFEKTYFRFNGKTILEKDYFRTVEDFFPLNINRIIVENLQYNKKLTDYKEEQLIKENMLTIVYKAKIKDKINNYYHLNGSEYVAIKKIKKESLKDELKLEKRKNEINDEDFEKEIMKFNRELINMEKCQCENSVEIYDYFDTEEYFVIIMELCDNNLLYELLKTKNGFNVNQIKDILLQLNNIFKKMHENNITHRDIKINNILVKYLDNKKTKFKVLLSDYGISNQLMSMSQNYSTHAGTPTIMAPEILEGEDYNDKCDIWSLGITIYYMLFKDLPYNGKCESKILKQIKTLGLSVLDKINDIKLKDLLSKMLVINPDERISWEDYFKHPFFT